MLVFDSVQTNNSTHFTFDDGTEVTTKIRLPIKGDAYYERPKSITTEQRKAIERETLMIVI